MRRGDHDDDDDDSDHHDKDDNDHGKDHGKDRDGGCKAGKVLIGPICIDIL